MANTNKAHTTPQVLIDEKAVSLNTLAAVVDLTRTTIEEATRTNKDAKEQIAEGFGFGVFQTTEFEVQVQRIEPKAPLVLDVEALNAFLDTQGKSVNDFMVKGKAPAPHNRVNVTALSEAAGEVFETGASQ